MRVVEHSVQLIHEHYTDKKLLLLHPANRYHTLILAALYADPPCPIWYHAASESDTSLHNAIMGFVTSLMAQAPEFDSQTYQLLRNGVSSAQQLGQSFASDLENMPYDNCLIILDEFDHIDLLDGMQQFVMSLIDNLPYHCHVLINGRRLPNIPWMALVAQQEAIIIGDSSLPTFLSYDTSSPTLEIYAFGSGQVLVNGEPVEWEGHLPRLLLFYALGQSKTTRDAICDAFWPNLERKQAVNVFHVTKRRLHRILGLDILQHEKGVYIINPELGVQYDVVEFIQTLETARDISGEAAIPHWEKLLQLYKGVYLQGRSEAWVQQRRLSYHAGYVQALDALIRLYQQVGRLAEASRLTRLRQAETD